MWQLGEREDPDFRRQWVSSGEQLVWSMSPGIRLGRETEIVLLGLDVSMSLILCMIPGCGCLYMFSFVGGGSFRDDG